MKKFWEEHEIYEKLKERRRGRKFYFLDGPPYTSSDLIHVGTGWNKVIKDAVIRYKRMRGYDVWDKPGYDCHGLPIEVAVEKALGFRTKRDIEELGVEKFIEECKKLVAKNARALTEQFRELGVFMDWSDPYMTLKDEYIESCWWLVKIAHEKGLLKRGVKVMHWCPRCQTVLADYEVSEYRDLEDPSIYVKFPVRGREREYLVIWTTTPWTLPANVAVMIHPEFDYARVEAGDEVLIMALERVRDVLDPLGVKYGILEVVKGRELVGLEYEHPLADEVPAQRRLENAHRVVPSEYVRREEGTGCVHSAPGHGEEDFEVCSRYGMPVLCPVDDEGKFTEEAGKYAGMRVREANAAIIEDLRAKGYLLREETIVHRYPVCWRCKTPLILRATEQWFIEVSKLKEDMLREAERVRWVPEWAGKSRFRNWLLGVRDWVISRQRYWGTPLPVWICERCGAIFVASSREELLSRAREKAELPELHRPWIDRLVLVCSECGGDMRRVPDVLDVWFDSGVAFYASLGYPKSRKLEELWPVDFVVEGHDQISGWFYSLMRVGVLGFGRAPYETVLMHGFALDEKGQEMHKSLGNFVSALEAIEPYGRDSFRLYVLSNTVWEDLRFSWRGLKEAYGDLNVMWNVYRFASTYMLLDRFDPRKKAVSPRSIEDLWILSRLQTLVREVTEYMEGYRLHAAARALRRFIVEDVSHRYIKLIRRRVWVEEEEESKLAAYATLYRVLFDYLRLIAPFTPFLAEYLYQEFFKKMEPELPESVHMLEWPEPDERLRNPELEELAELAFGVIEAGLAARNKAGIKIRQPLSELIVATDDAKLRKAVDTFSEAVESLVNVRRVRVEKRSYASKLIKYELKPIYSKLGPAFKGLTKEIAELLEERGEEIAARLLEEGSAEIEVGGERVLLTREYVEIVERAREDYEISEMEGGIVAICTRISERERVEGLARDVVRRIQYMRKELDLPIDAYVNVRISAPEDVVDDLRKVEDYVRAEARVKKLEYVGREDVAGRFVREWDIGGVEIVVGVEPASA